MKTPKGRSRSTKGQGAGKGGVQGRRLHRRFAKERERLLSFIEEMLGIPRKARREAPGPSRTVIARKARVPPVSLEWDDEEGVYNVSVPSLPGCLSWGRTRREALLNIKDAILGYLEVTERYGDPIAVRKRPCRPSKT